MDNVLPSDVQKGLDAARRAAMLKGNRLRVRAGDDTHRVLRYWPQGFAMAIDAPRLRGLVDIYDGARHLSRCLIIAASEEGDELHYEFKRMTEASGTQPLDFVRRPDAPAALLGRPD